MTFAFFFFWLYILPFAGAYVFETDNPLKYTQKISFWSHILFLSSLITELVGLSVHIEDLRILQLHLRCWCFCSVRIISTCSADPNSNVYNFQIYWNRSRKGWRIKRNLSIKFFVLPASCQVVVCPSKNICNLFVNCLWWQWYFSFLSQR